jgi:hypothetical protein
VRGAECAAHAAHLMYEGVTTPFTTGGTAGNQPE